MRRRKLICIETTLAKTIFIFLKNIYKSVATNSIENRLYLTLFRNLKTRKRIMAAEDDEKKLKKLKKSVFSSSFKKLYFLAVSKNCFTALICFLKLRKQKQQTRNMLPNVFLENPVKHSQKNIQRKLYFLSKSSTTECLVAFSARKTFNYFLIPLKKVLKVCLTYQN